jgi:hypothetical protein
MATPDAKRFTKDEFLALMMGEFKMWATDRTQTFDGWFYSVEDWHGQMRKHYQVPAESPQERQEQRLADERGWGEEPYAEPFNHNLVR